MPASNGIRVARPAFEVGGTKYASLSDGLLSLLVRENDEGLYRCEATFGNWGSTGRAPDFLYFDRATFDFGKSLRVVIGADTLFEGRITGLEANYPAGRAPELVVLAEDRLQDLRMTRRTRSFDDVSDADVVRRLASDHSLQAQVDLPGPTHKVLVQVNQSDLAFLRERVRAADGELWMEGTALHVTRRSSRTPEPLPLRYPTELREFSVVADLAMQRSSLSVAGWDVSAKEAAKADASDSPFRSELNGDVSGPSLVQSALGARRESIAHLVPWTRGEAQAQADSVFARLARRFVVGRGIADTDPRLAVGARVELSGLGTMFGGKYYVSEVCHRFDGVQGIRTEFLAERPGIGSGS